MKRVIILMALCCLPLSCPVYAAFPHTEKFNREQQCAARQLSSSPSYVKVTVESAVSGESFDSVITSVELAEAIATEFDLWPKAGEENPAGTVMNEERAHLFSQFRILKVLMAHPDLRFKFASGVTIESLRPLYEGVLLSDIRTFIDKHLAFGKLDAGAVQKLNARYAGLESGVGRAAIAHVLLEKGIHSFVQDLGQTVEIDLAPCEMHGEEFLGYAIVSMAGHGHDFATLGATPVVRRRVSWPHEFKREQWCAALNYSPSPSYVVVHVTDESSGEGFTSVVESIALHQAVAVEYGISLVEGHSNATDQIITQHEDLRFEFRRQEAIALLRPRYGERHLLYARSILSERIKEDITAKFAVGQVTQSVVSAGENYWAQIEAAAYVLFELGFYPSRDDISPTLRIRPSPCEYKEQGERMAGVVRRNVRLLNSIQSFR